MPPPTMEDQFMGRMGQLRLRDLFLLEQIAAHGTLRKVAEAIHVTQPAVTQALQVLERAFGVPLVERGRRGVTLSDAGQAALARLLAARNEMAAARAVARSPKAPVVRVGTSPMASFDVLPRGLQRLHAAHAQIRVELTEGSVPELWNAIEDGSLDAILTRPMGSIGQLRAMSSEIAMQVVARERLVPVAPRTHPAARRRTDAAALARHAWVLPPPSSLVMREFDQWFASYHVVPPEGAVVSASFHSNLRIAASCGMLTLAPETAARAQAAELGMKIVATAWEIPPSDIVFACRASALGNPVVTALRESFAPEARQAR